MARDPLQVLQVIRRRAVEQARYALGACQKAEADVEARIRVLDDTVRRDGDVSGAWQDAHHFVEMAAMRLAATRAERRIAAAELTAAVARSGVARGIVTAARTAAEAVEQLIEERAGAGRLETLRREQHVLDDIARGRLHGSGRT
jgi:flagellar biosynthesis chaperone FliJ